MVDYLTERNGVVCNSCFKTIDLTTMSWSQPTGLTKPLENILDSRPFFNATCPHCNGKSSYSKERDVKPILDWEDKEKVYLKTISDLQEEKTKARNDAKFMAR